VLGSIIERVGAYKIVYREPVFQNLVRSIVYQQLSGKAALTSASDIRAGSVAVRTMKLAAGSGGPCV